ncbi:unnamed protein product [Dibothriocephalus latus]|uniref:Uncharacterized protein n=1 Tax=Dibothriocephalus latus TaxID=60516 RepID=A0A3P7PAB5_DIBLA|nr:unnamed protein product [Dibothriocephalus latus]
MRQIAASSDKMASLKLRVPASPLASLPVPAVVVPVQDLVPIAYAFSMQNSARKPTGVYSLVLSIQHRETSVPENRGKHFLWFCRLELHFLRL